MAIESEVLVIGGGIAGLSAALSAARAGANVRLVSEAETTLGQASGLLDVLGYTPAGEGPLADPFAEFAALPPTHPYAVVGETTVRDALAMIDDVLDGYRGGHTDVNALVPTVGGSVKPTARYPASVAAGLAGDGRSMLLVGFERLTAFDAPLAAAHLAETGLLAAVAGATVDFPVAVEDDTIVTRFAHVLDENRTIEGREGPRTVRAALAERVRPHCEGVERVGFPAVLGQEHPEAVRADLADRLGVAVFEVPMGPPSLLGMRLEAALYAALEAAGGRIETGRPVVGVAGDDRIAAVHLDRSGQRIPFAADQFVLATGGVAGGGVEADRERVVEPLFGCRVDHPAGREAWAELAAFGDHAFPRFGVRVDDSLRPTDAGGAPEYPNLRAAGAMIAGADYPAEKSGSGVSIATGYAAGRRAAREATA